MERDRIQETVLKYLGRALDREPSSLDSAESMKDMGANSLDIVEVVSSSMRELRVKVPRSELASIPNIDGLVDLLLVKATEKGL